MLPFLGLVQAYKALTDEVSKENYKKYGHPDGPQAMSGAQSGGTGRKKLARQLARLKLLASQIQDRRGSALRGPDAGNPPILCGLDLRCPQSLWPCPSGSSPRISRRRPSSCWSCCLAAS